MRNNSNFKNRWPFIGLLIYLSSLSLSAEEMAINFITTSLESAQNMAAREDKLFFIYYGADWCMPCKWMEENTFSDSALIRYVNQKYIAVKADINTANGRVLKKQFDVANLPSILVFAASGKLIDRKSTSLKADEMLTWLQSLDLARHHLSQIYALNISSGSPALESPRVNIHFQRPSLIPDDSPAGLLSELEQNNPTMADAAITAIDHTSFMPRSTLRYGIKLNERTYSYQLAVREVLVLEKKYNQPTELSPEADQKLSIIIGDFETTGKARTFLNFLNRNDIKGEVIILK